MKKISFLLGTIMIVNSIFLSGCTLDDSDETDSIDYSKYIYETAMDFKYEHSTASENRHCRIYVDGIEIGKIDDGEVKSKFVTLEGGYHDIYVESITIIRKPAHSLKQYFEVNDDNNCFEFTIKDGAVLGLTISCSDSYYSDELSRTDKES